MLSLFGNHLLLRGPDEPFPAKSKMKKSNYPLYSKKH